MSNPYNEEDEIHVPNQKHILCVIFEIHYGSKVLIQLGRHVATFYRNLLSTFMLLSCTGRQEVPPKNLESVY